MWIVTEFLLQGRYLAPNVGPDSWRHGSQNRLEGVHGVRSLRTRDGLSLRNRPQRPILQFHYVAGQFALVELGLLPSLCLACNLQVGLLHVHLLCLLSDGSLLLPRLVGRFSVLRAELREGGEERAHPNIPPEK